MPNAVMGIVLALATGKAPKTGICREGVKNEEILSQKTGLKVDMERLDRCSFFRNKGNIMKKIVTIIQCSKSHHGNQYDGLWGLGSIPLSFSQNCSLI